MAVKKDPQSNKQLGTWFEQYVCTMLAHRGWWAHFITPSRIGSQPFDIIAMKGDKVLALDCKTCSTPNFSLSRVEDNQMFAFDNMTQKTSAVCGFLVQWNNKIYFLKWDFVRTAIFMGRSSIKLTDERLFDFDESLCSE